MQTQSFNAWFWTGSHKGENCHLFIDNVDKGPLPVLDDAPACDDLSSKQAALYVQLPSGNYELEIKDEKGEIKYAEVLRIKRSMGSTTIGSTTEWTSSGARGTNKEDCLIREIYF